MQVSQIMHDQGKFRILMIHGYATCGQRFEAKTRPMSTRIIELLTPDVLDEFPAGIEFLYPDAPIILECPIGLGDEGRDKEHKHQDQSQDDLSQDGRDPFSRGWWYGRDNVSVYKGLEDSLRSVAEYMRMRPIHGLIAFSQGAALGGMIASMIDCRVNPNKASAIRAQGLPVDDFLNLPDQEPLRFFVGCGGYCGTLKYYGSLYEWPIRTPSCHTLATMDAVVADFQTMKFADSFSSREIIHYYGSHFVPRDRATVEAIAKFILENSGRKITSKITTTGLSLIRTRSTKNKSDRVYAEQDYNPVTSLAFWRRERKTFAIRYRRKSNVHPRRFVPLINGDMCHVL